MSDPFAAIFGPKHWRSQLLHIRIAMDEDECPYVVSAAVGKFNKEGYKCDKKRCAARTTAGGSLCDVCWLQSSVDGCGPGFLFEDDKSKLVPTPTHDLLITGSLWGSKYEGHEGTDYDEGFNVAAIALEPRK